MNSAYEHPVLEAHFVRSNELSIFHILSSYI